jgi:NADH-quinone oxidoreductase subunit L
MPNYAYIVLIPLLPLAGFVLLGLFGRRYFRRSSGVIGTALLLVATGLALWVAYGYFFDWGKLNGWRISDHRAGCLHPGCPFLRVFPST